jgi:hypothetical protein
MRRQFHTPEGIIERELTQDEITQFASMGDSEVKKELARQQWKMTGTWEQKINIIAELLGLK